MADLLAGRAQLIVGSLLPTVPHFKTGKLRPLSVTTAKRWYSLPDIPTVAETVPGYEVELWFGVMAPRGTPQAVIDQLNGAVNKMAQDADMKKNLEQQGMVPSGGAPARFAERIRKDYDRWTNVVSACRRCNQHKGNRLLHEIDMELLALPFQPNRAEYLALTNSRRIRADQQDYLSDMFSANYRALA